MDDEIIRENDEEVDPIESEEKSAEGAEDTEVAGDESDEEVAGETGESAEGAEYDGPMGNYTVTGLVDFSDEQGNIRGQLPVGSVQHVPTAVGDKWVEAGQAEKVEDEEGVE